MSDEQCANPGLELIPLKYDDRRDDEHSAACEEYRTDGECSCPVKHAAADDRRDSCPECRREMDCGRRHTTPEEIAAADALCQETQDMERHQAYEEAILTGFNEETEEIDTDVAAGAVIAKADAEIKKFKDSLTAERMRRAHAQGIAARLRTDNDRLRYELDRIRNGYEGGTNV